MKKHFEMSRGKKNVGRVILSGLISFVATNADDLIVLLNFFLESPIGRSSLRALDIILGQYLAVSLLLSISLIGYFSLSSFLCQCWDFSVGFLFCSV